jgi:hypothetical protein
MLRSVQKVRQNAPLTTSAVAGDGKGTENPVRCDGSNKLVLFVYVDRPDVNTTDYSFIVEWQSGGDDPYRDTTGTVTSGTDARLKTTFNVHATELPASPSEGRFAIVIPVRGRIARISALSAFTGTAPKCSIYAATASTVGGEGWSQGPFPVRKAAAIAVSTSVLGDGRGGENPVPIHGADRVVLFVNGDIVSGGTLEIYMETTPNGLDYYHETYWTGSGTVTPQLKKYTIAAAEFLVGGNPVGLSFGLEALGAYARFNFTPTTQAANNVACHALIGRA